jgi:hypothetical protein
MPLAPGARVDNPSESRPTVGTMRRRRGSSGRPASPSFRVFFHPNRMMPAAVVVSTQASART